MQDIKTQIKEWIVDKKRIEDADAFDNTTALLDTKILKSVDIADLILFIEFMRDEPVNITELQAGAFHSIDAIAQHFFARGTS